MKIEEYAFNRLQKLKNELLTKIPIIKGIKLSGSSADGHFFLLQFGDTYISSDYDVVVLLERYPTEIEIKTLKKILSKPIYNDMLENMLLENLDIKILSMEYPYKGSGIKTASIFDRDISIARHLIGGKIVYGHEYFASIEIKDGWIKRQLAYRVLERKRIFDVFTELGAYDRIATILGLNDMIMKIRNIIEIFRDYHKLSPEEVEELKKECRDIKKELLEKIRK